MLDNKLEWMKAELRADEFDIPDTWIPGILDGTQSASPIVIDYVLELEREWEALV